MTTVFMLDGYGVDNIIPLQMKGVGLKGNVTVRVPYDNHNSALASVVNGAATLDEMLHNKQYDGDKEVRGYSMGSSVAQYWLRHYGPTSDLDPAKLRFTLMANPERRYTGFAIVAPTLVDEWFTPDVALQLKPYLMQYDGVGVPEDTPYSVVDIACQYDGVADCPNKPSPNATAITVAGAGILTLHNFGYWNINPDDLANPTFTDKNYKQILIPTYPLPSQIAGWFFKGSQIVKLLDRLTRPTVEVCYDRPANVPLPKYEAWYSFFGL